MNWGVRWSFGGWQVFNLLSNKTYSTHTFEFMARRKARHLNERNA